MEKIKDIFSILKPLIGNFSGSVIIYDGECIFCKKYVSYYQLKKTVGLLQIVNAREVPLLIKELNIMGIDIDKGMVFIHKDSIYHGSEAIHMLALLSTKSDIFNKINSKIFSCKLLSQLLYPLLKLGRTITLIILNKSTIHKRKRPF
jgi:hypothetical protein